MNYLETLKNIAKDKNKRVENLIFLVILLVILLVAVNYIFNTEKISSKNNDTSNNTSNNNNINSNSNTQNLSNVSNIQSELEVKLSNILSQISGISEVSVVITYSKDATTTPVYNTKEQEKSGEKTTEKTVAYNEEGNDKTAIIESVELPKVEGAIIVAKGANTVEMKSKIASAISNLTNVPVYKIQVFEKKS